MPADTLQLLQTLDAQDAVYTRQELVAHLPSLLDAGPSVWPVAASRMHTRFNRYLFLNAPELWHNMDVSAWQQVMLSVGDRSYAPGDVFSTGRFDDLKFLCHFVAIDGIQLYFQTISPSSQEQHVERLWVARHVQACTFMYLPMRDPEEELDDSHVTLADLANYRITLQQQQPQLRPAHEDEETVRTELNRYIAQGGNGT